ncbi:MAG: WD40 repeat domain-containing protein [Epsilonproteobacteria bacterium]|nr:WD40 repeat domain-containing protein [Campylobacterota bacterium]
MNNHSYLRKIILCLHFLLLFICSCQALVVGSNAVFSRASETVFSAVDSDNKMIGFVAMEDGFTLQDKMTTCSFDAFFPVSGNVNLNGGKLYLTQDLIFSNTYKIKSPGRIYGNNDYAVTLGKQLGEIVLPNVSQNGSLISITSKDMQDDVFSVDWSHDSQYLAVGIDGNGGLDELQVLYFDGSTLTKTQGVDLGKDVLSVRWHPSDHYLAIGRQSGSGAEFCVYYLNVSNGTFTLQDSVELGSRRVYATGWTPDGAHVLTGLSSGTDELRLYSFSTGSGTLTEVATADFATNRHVNMDALSWSPWGDYFAVGTRRDTDAGVTELLLYEFDGASLTLTVSVDLNADVEAVSWSPTSSYIAVGTDTGSERVKMYFYNHSAGRLELRISESESREVEDLHFDPSGTLLATGLDAGSSSKVKVYSFDAGSEVLTFLDEVASNNDVTTVRWAPNGQCIAHGSKNDNVVVSKFLMEGFLFDNLTLVLCDDARFIEDVFIDGTCKIVGNGKKLSINDGKSIFVRPSANLTIEDACLSNFGQGKLVCMDDSGGIVLKNTQITLSRDYTFSHGAVAFEDEVLISGTSKFVYASSRSSTINSASVVKFDRSVTLSYNPGVARKDLLYFDDSTAMLFFNGCNLHATHTGLELSGGMLVFDGSVSVSSEARNSAESVVFKSDLDVRVLGNATINLYGIITSD